MSKKEFRYCNGCGTKLEKEQIEKVNRGVLTYCELCGKELTIEKKADLIDDLNPQIFNNNKSKKLEMSEELQEDIADLEEMLEKIEESVDNVKEAEEEERVAAQEVNEAKKNYEYAKKLNSVRESEIALKKFKRKLAKHQIKEKRLQKAKERAKKYQRKAFKIKTDVERADEFSSLGGMISNKVENWTSNLLNKIDKEIQGKTGQNLKGLIEQFASEEAKEAIAKEMDSQMVDNITEDLPGKTTTSDSAITSTIYPPFSSYAGKEPFIFISYAHEDKKLVYPEIEILHKDGLKIWYDEGIPLSTRWNDEVAKKLVDSSCFLVFISPRSIKSKNVQNEINFALKYEKKFIPVYLEETVLPSGLELQLVSIQGIHKNKMTEVQYQAKILEDLQKILNK